MLTRTFLFIAAVTITIPSAPAQPTIGLPPFGSFSGGPFDVVNNANLNVHFGIPIINKAGRGIAFDYTVTYDSSVWSNKSSSGASAWTPVTSTNWGWGNLTQASQNLSGYVTYRTTSPQCGPNPNYWMYQYDNFVYYDPSGTAHALPGTMIYYVVNCYGPMNVPTSATVSLNDGSGYTTTVQSYYNGAYLSKAVTRDGTAVSLPLGLSGPTVKTDRNGNKITGTYSNGVTTFTDTLNTTALTASGSATPTSPISLAYTNPQNTASAYTVKYTANNVQTAFGCSGISEYGPTLVNLVSEIDLPDQVQNPSDKYTITYETTPGDVHNPHYVTGRIASITLPTGGTINYSYSGGSHGITCSDGSTATLTRQTPDGTWTYAHTIPAYPNPWETTITDPQSNVASLKFQGGWNGTAVTNAMYEVQRTVNMGSSGTLTVYTCYNYAPLPCTASVVTVPFSQAAITRKLPSTTSSTVESQTVSLYNSAGVPTEVDEYNYGPSSTSPQPGGLARKTVIAYASLGNGIADKPSSVTVYDSDGTTIKAQTTYVYDEGTPAVTSAPQHDAVTGSRGNATTVKRWLNTSTYLSQTFTYFDTGDAQTATDVTGAVTTYTYGACGSSLLTATSVTGSGLANPLTTSATWDTYCYGGVPRTATDPNSQTTTTYYTDATFWAPTSVVDPTGATTNFTYTPYCGSTPASVESALNFATSSTVDNFTSLDLLGRAHISQRKQSQSATTYDSVQTDYDSLGRVSRVTVPYPAGKNGTQPGGNATTTIYDALGRPTQITDGGGGWTKYTYNQNDVLIEVGPQVTSPLPENTKRRQLEYDALGRLTSVCELTTVSGSGYGTCSQNVSQSGYWTTYTYNVLDRLTGVIQNAQVASPRQTRTYVYNDWLGRMTSETNPESGTVSYSYDSDAECAGTYNGDMVKRTDARNNKTCYQYDALHRLTASLPRSGSPDYSITPQKHYVYDQSPALGSMGRLGHAYTCPASTPDCTSSSTWITDLGFVYTSRGELSDVWEHTPNSNGGYYHVSATYWPNGLINTLNPNLSGLPSWTYNPEGEGRVKSVIASSGQNPVPDTTPVTYNLYGFPNTVTFGSGDSNSFLYDSATGRMTQYQATVAGSSMTGVLTWNPNGSLRQLAIADGFYADHAQTCTYQHDDLARIAAANCPGKWTQSFSYGSNGFGNVNWSGTTTFNWPYDAANHYQGFGTYDANGNLTNDTTHTYSWDADGNLYLMDSTAMTYDALGRRVERAVGPTYTEIVYGPGGGKLALVNGSNQSVKSVFLPLPGGATAVYDASGINRYRHADWLGSSRLSSDPSRSVVYDGAYSPTGESYSEAGAKDRNFTGQNQDLTNFSNADLYDFQYREYQSIRGRWISPDPAGLAAVNPANPQSWNRYAYVNGDPMRHKDPKGLCLQWFGPQTGPQGDCVNAGLSAYAMNQDTFWSWKPGGGSNSENPYGPGFPSGEMFDSWTNAPTKGLSNQGTIFDADLGAMQGGYYAAERGKEFWNNLAKDYPGPKTQIQLGMISGGILGPKSELKGEPTPDQVGAAPSGGPSSITGPMTLPFAPNPTYLPGSCQKGQHWQPDPYNIAAGTCQPDGLPQQPQPTP